MTKSFKVTEQTPFEDIPEQVRCDAYEIAEGWYGLTRIDWDDVLDRLDGTKLEDGRVLDIQTTIGPGIEGLKAHVRKIRARVESLNVPCEGVTVSGFLSDAGTGFETALWCDVASGFGSTPLFDRITARSIKF